MSNIDMERAHRIAALGRLDGIKRGLAGCGSRRSPPRLLLQAVVAQYGADMDRCLNCFHVALETCTDSQRAYVIDIYAPVLLMQGKFEQAESIVSSVSEPPEALSGLFEALRAMIKSFCTGKFVMPVESDFVSDELNRARAQQRLAIAGLYSDDFEFAAESSRSAAIKFERLRAYRSAAAALSVTYHIQHAVTGDLEQAYALSKRVTMLAEKARDRSFRMAGLVAQYEIAAEFGDDEVVARLKASINRSALATQYQERFARGVADLLPYAWSGDFAAFRTNAILLRELPGMNRPAIAFASALRSLAEAALGDIVEARRCSRTAMALAALPKKGEPAHEARYRRLARTIAAATCVMIGDAARGQRAMSAKAVRTDDVSDVMSAASGLDWQRSDLRVRGYARAVSAARFASNTLRCGHLTKGELEVLQMLAEGRSAPQIALELGRSVHTVRAHTRNVIGKFDVSGRVAAIYHARRIGLII